MDSVVIDTNIWVAAAYRPLSSSGRITSACENGELTLIASDATLGEYDHILRRAIRKRDALSRQLSIIAKAILVEPIDVGRVVPEDPSDDKFVGTAVAASATLVSNDRRVLEVVRYRGSRVMTPRAFVAWYWGEW